MGCSRSVMCKADQVFLCVEGTVGCVVVWATDAKCDFIAGAWYVVWVEDTVGVGEHSCYRCRGPAWAWCPEPMGSMYRGHGWCC